MNWISDYPSALLIPMAKPTSDLIPCMAQIGTDIPKAQLFRFENFWLDQPGFLDIVQTTWISDVRASNSVTKVSAKLKLLRRVLRRWAHNLSGLKNQLTHCNKTLAVLDKNRPLFIQEHNFRKILKKHILKLLQWQKDYWRTRCSVRWTKLGDESAKFFHAAPTERFRINTITSLDTENGRLLCSHLEKATLLWEEYRKGLVVLVK
jgi:hypothetical protein